MKSGFKTIFIIVGLLIFSNIFCQDNFDNNDTLTLLLNDSKVNNKKLFLLFGWQGCRWCRLYDNYHNDSIVNEILDKYFVITRIDILKTKAGADLYKKYGKGTPSWIIFDINGEVLIDSDNGNGTIGYPTKENELEYYVQALKKAALVISEKESEILVTKLKEYRNRKN